MGIRPPAVAGSFYEGTAPSLQRQLDACFAAAEPSTTKVTFIGAVAPHAGLVYSGHVAASLYQALELPRAFVILCPNHTGLGSSAAIDPSGAWRTPLGDARIDEELAAALMREAPIVREDRIAHAREHSLEVQLPFLQRLLPEFSFVPLCLSLSSFERIAEVGRAIAAVVRGAGRPVGIVASSDLNHYEDQATTLSKDQAAIDRILELDPEGLWNVVREREISMCGVIPTAAMLVAALELGATRARLLRHATSGDVSGDYDAVVGYAALAIF